MCLCVFALSSFESERYIINKRWYWIIGALLIISALLRHELLFLFSIILALVAGAAALWARYCLVGVTYRRRFGSTRLYFGEETELHVEITNAKPLPLAWLRADDSVPAATPLLSHQVEDLPDERRQLVNVLALRWYERVTRRYRVRGAQRGAWTFGPVHLRSGDLFGFNIVRLTIEPNSGKPNSGEPNTGVQSDTILVFPRIVPLTALGLPARHPFGDFRTGRRLIEDPLRMMGVRDYAHGDNFRHVHWKATAHSQTLQTKVFEPSAQQPVMLFLNINTAEHFYEGLDWELSEYAITAAASLTRQLWEEGRPVGLVCNALTAGSNRYIRIPARNHPGQLVNILTALAQINERRARWPLETLLPIEARSLPYGATIVAISALINRRLEQTLVDLRRREYGVALVALGAAHLTTPLPNVQYYHIGGREQWYALESLALA